MILYIMSDTNSVTGAKSSTDESAGTQLMGRCKWFNNKAGYGFLTVVSGGESKWDGVDVFVHHSAVTTETEQYKYLVQGEYVSFNLQTMEGGDHEYQASDVRGVNGGKLMCETRNEQRQQRAEKEDGEGDDEQGSRGGAHQRRSHQREWRSAAVRRPLWPIERRPARWHPQHVDAVAARHVHPCVLLAGEERCGAHAATAH